MAQGRVFLSAEWQNLVMLNYRVDPAILERLVPRGTELDSFEGVMYVSVVGFQFLRTRIFGVVPIPFHVNFDEVNLRFYVRRREGSEVRRGVVFVKEMVPRRAIAQVARWSYGEKYFACPMRHTISRTEFPSAEYEWKFRGEWCAVSAAASSAAFLPAAGSWNSSSPNIIGGIRQSATGSTPSTGSPMCRGGCGQRRRRISKGMGMRCTAPGLATI